MNKLIILVVLLLNISFSTSQQHMKIAPEIIKIEQPEIIKGIIINDKDYTLNLDLERSKDKKLTLVIRMKLYNNAHYISPSTKREFKGKFNIDLGSYTHLDFDGDLIESPHSIEMFDTHHLVSGTINWVRVNTTYKQPVYIKSKEDFEVFGRVQFTIEPRCTFEEIPFSISYKNGVIKIISPKC